MTQQTFVFANAPRPQIPDLEARLRDAMRTYEGEHLATIADLVILRTGRATDAIHLSLGVLKTLTTVGPSGARIGVDTGVAVRDGNHWGGPAIELAGRLAEHATPGQVLTTAATRQATDRGQIDFIGLGEHPLHDQRQPITIYRAHRITDTTPPGRIDIDPICGVAVDATCAVRIAGALRSPAFCSSACAEAWATRSEPRA